MKAIAPTLLLIVVVVSPAVFSQQIHSSIRSVDFSNFTYPYTWDLLVTGSRRKTFKLQDGKFQDAKNAAGMSLAHVLYGDVTGDGREEAIVFLGVHTGGSAIPGCVYIYSIRKNHPNLLWGFTTGDRADGGLRQAYAEEGQLVVELYGRGTHPGGNLYGTEETGACCAKSVTRSHYEWSRNKFRRSGKSEIFPNPAGHSSPVWFVKS